MANLSIEAASRYLAITNLAMQLRLLDHNRNTQGGVKFTFPVNSPTWRPKSEGEINEAFFCLQRTASSDEEAQGYVYESARFLKDLRRPRGKSGLYFRNIIHNELGLTVE